MAHAILVTMYHMLSRQTAYADLVVNYLAKRQQARTEATLVRHLERLGYDVALQPRAG